jgi:hypothetical protein
MFIFFPKKSHSELNTATFSTMAYEEHLDIKLYVKNYMSLLQKKNTTPSWATTTFYTVAYEMQSSECEHGIMVKEMRIFQLMDQEP